MKNPLSEKYANFLQNEKQLWDLFYEINPDISISRTTFYPSGNIKILPKTTFDCSLQIIILSAMLFKESPKTT